MKEFNPDWLQTTMIIYVVSLFNIESDKIEQQHFSEDKAEAMEYTAELKRTSGSSYEVWMSQQDYTLIPLLESRTIITD